MGIFSSEHRAGEISSSLRQYKAHHDCAHCQKQIFPHSGHCFQTGSLLSGLWPPSLETRWGFCRVFGFSQAMATLKTSHMRLDKREGFSKHTSRLTIFRHSSANHLTLQLLPFSLLLIPSLLLSPVLSSFKAQIKFAPETVSHRCYSTLSLSHWELEPLIFCTHHLPPGCLRLLSVSLVSLPRM